MMEELLLSAILAVLLWPKAKNAFRSKLINWRNRRG